MLKMIDKKWAQAAQSLFGTIAFGVVFAFAVPSTQAGVAALPEGKIEIASLPKDRADYFLYVPRSLGASPEILVAVHGISRNAEDYAKLLAPYADIYGVIVIAPYFPREVFRDYQRLGRVGLGRRADHTLEAMVAEVRKSYPNARPGISLFGFSGGAQFAHRYAMAHGEKVNRVVIGAAGWYTFPTYGQGFPYGIRPTRRLFRTYFNPHEFLEVPMHVIVGSDDGNRSGSLNTAPQINRQQGYTRVERAKSWVAAMQAKAVQKGYEPRVSIEIIPGARHSFVESVQNYGLGDRIFEYLFGPMPENREQFASAEAAG